MLKTDLHIHTKGCKEHAHEKMHSAKEIIDNCAKKGFEVISITNHDQVIYNPKTVKYAKEKGILLIPGCEKTIKGKHVLIYNITQEQADKIKEFSDLEKIKKQGGVIIAAHPYFVLSNCLGKELKKNIELFDAIEYSSFCTMLLNFNKKAVKIAKKYSKPIIGNSDAHTLRQIGATYTLIEAEKTKESILQAIKNNKVELKTNYVSNFWFIHQVIKVITNPIRQKFS